MTQNKTFDLIFSPQEALPLYQAYLDDLRKRLSQEARKVKALDEKSRQLDIVSQRHELKK